MSHKPNQEADISNANKGTPGTNITWDKAQGNRGAQLNPNQRPEHHEAPRPEAPRGSGKQDK